MNKPNIEAEKTLGWIGDTIDALPHSFPILSVRQFLLSFVDNLEERLVDEFYNQGGQSLKSEYVRNTFSRAVLNAILPKLLTDRTTLQKEKTGIWIDQKKKEIKSRFHSNNEKLTYRQTELFITCFGRHIHAHLVATGRVSGPAVRSAIDYALKTAFPV